MTTVVSGAGGLIGAALVRQLIARGQPVIRLVRPGHPSDPSSVIWDPASGIADIDRLSGANAVVHLAGENLVGRWTDAKRAAIRQSRVVGTTTLCESLARMPHPPQTLITASAIGYYGDRGDERLRDDSAPGLGFLPDVCRAWETATQPAARRGIRVAHLRFGVVLGREGGALAKMLPPFRLGLGGRLGSGRQWMSWITLDDVVGAIEHVMRTPALRGPINVVAPTPVTNADFTKALGRALHRPAWFPVPAPVLRAILGDLADEALLSSLRVEPTKLLASGYRFHDPVLDPALRRLVGH